LLVYGVVVGVTASVVFITFATIFVVICVIFFAIVVVRVPLMVVVSLGRAFFSLLNGLSACILVVPFARGLVVKACVNVGVNR